MILIRTIIILLLFSSFEGFGKECKVSTIVEFESAVKHLVPGDKIILQNGIWENVNLHFKGNGTKEHPIILTAETDGEVIISGDSSLKLAGQYLVVKGLWFKNGYTKEKAVISFRVNSKEYAINSRVTNTAITHYNPEDPFKQYFYLELWGRDNVVDFNHFEGKTNEGPTLVVWLAGEAHHNNKHLIKNNYFGNRPALGKNGGETIRIGTSHNSMYSSQTVVEENVFYQCNGESEIISNKSHDNIFRKNLFQESQGSLTLRHGNGALVENNVFKGNGKKHTGGVRIINEGHIVRNNLFMGLRGSGSKGSLVIMNGVPNSPLNRYHQVKNAWVLNNTFIDSSPIQFGAGSDKERTLPPKESYFFNNLIINPWGNDVIENHDDISGIKFQNNLVLGDEIIQPKNFNWGKMKLIKCGDIIFPDFRQINDYDFNVNIEIPETDITNKKRTTFGVGAFAYGNYEIPKALDLQAGPEWMKKIKN